MIKHAMILFSVVKFNKPLSGQSKQYENQEFDSSGIVRY